MERRGSRGKFALNPLPSAIQTAAHSAHSAVNGLSRLLPLGRGDDLRGEWAVGLKAQHFGVRSADARISYF